MLRRLLNLPLTAASRAAKAFQDREDARTKEKYGTAHDPGSVPVHRAGVDDTVTAASGQAPTMAAAAALDALKAGRPIAFVDVREAARWSAGHIRGAVHMPMAEINVRVSELPWDALVVAYCDDGSVSATAVAFFQVRGQEDTFVLEGGFPAWARAGGEVAT